MAITTNSLTSGQVFLTNLKYMEIIPCTDDNGYVYGESSYRFDSLVADETSIEQDDNETNERDSEIRDEPIISNTVLGSYQIAAVSVDVQDEVLKAVNSWVIGSTDTDISYAPTSYKNLWCAVIFAFNSTDKCLVAPRVKLNSKVVVSSLKTSSGEVDIAGTAYSGYLIIDSGQIETPLASVPSEKVDTVLGITRESSEP